MKNAATKTIDTGNNESISSGVFKTPDGWLAMTFTQSQTFKTRAAAERWHARKTGKAV
jgi:Protein of unknown function (DUF1391)